MTLVVPPVQLGTFVRRCRDRGELVVQPRMGMADPALMASGLRAVRELPACTVGTITLDSYTRVGDYAGARQALDSGGPLNGYPMLSHDLQTTRSFVGEVERTMPVQVRHGSAKPNKIFRVMVDAGLSASEGGPVSYCLPYGRTPLAESVRHWCDAVDELAQDGRSRGFRPHLESFGGCLLGQLCPPSLLLAVSLLECMFFVQHGIDSVSLSYAQQTDMVQDIEALGALRALAQKHLPEHVDWHIVLYTYMGVYPKSPSGATRLLELSAALAVLGAAERLNPDRHGEHRCTRACVTDGRANRRFERPALGARDRSRGCSRRGGGPRRLRPQPVRRHRYGHASGFLARPAGRAVLSSPGQSRAGQGHD